MGRDSFQQAAWRIAEKAPDMPGLLQTCEPDIQEQEDLLWRTWIVELEGQALDKAEEDGKLPILKRLMVDFSWYVNHLYRAELLCPERLAVLPTFHRFGYWAGLALDAQKAGDAKTYLRILSEASKSCPDMTEAIKLLLKDFEQQEQEQQENAEEFTRLGIMVKKQFYLLCSGGQREAAKQVLATYRGLCPDDPELTAMEKALEAPSGPVPEF